MIVYNPIADAQTESRSLPARFAGKKRFKELVKNTLRNSGSGIFNDNPDYPAIRRFMWITAYFYLLIYRWSRMALVQGKSAVVYDIEYYLLKLQVISNERAGPLREFCFNADPIFRQLMIY